MVKNKFMTLFIIQICFVSMTFPIMQIKMIQNPLDFLTIGYEMIENLQSNSCDKTNSIEALSNDMDIKDISLFYEEIYNISLVTNLPTTDIAWDLWVSGNYAYVAATDAGLAIFNITDPTNPALIKYVTTTHSIYDVCVSGNYLYLAAGNSGLQIVNITDPTSASTVIYKDTDNIAHGVFVSGNYVYMSIMDSKKLAIIDISNPASPGDPSYVTLTDSGLGVFIHNNYAYVATASSGLAIIDITNPLSPSVLGYGDTSYATNVFVSDHYAFLSDSANALAIIDVSNPTSPGSSAYESASTWGFDVFVAHGYAFVADSSSGVAVIEIFDKTNPNTIMHGSTGQITRGVFVSGDYVYTACENGFYILKLGIRNLINYDLLMVLLAIIMANSGGGGFLGLSTEMWLIIGAVGAASILIVVVAAKSKKTVKKRKLDNIKTEIKGKKLLLTFDITKKLGKSSTDKTIIVANSHGDWAIKGTDLSFGMYAFKYPKKKDVKEKPQEMQNIDVKLDKNKVTLTIDVKKDFGPSTSGKSIIVASTRGNKLIKDTGVYLGLNVYKPKKK